MSVSVQWLPMSWLTVRTQRAVVHIDPVYAGSMFDLFSMMLFPRSFSKAERVAGGLEAGDLILISHDHLDHCSRGMVERLSKEGTKVLAPPSCRKKLGALMTEMGAGKTAEVGDVEVRAVPAYNPLGSRRMAYHPEGRGVGYVISAGGMRIYHAGDTGLTEEMGALGPIDVAFLPIGGRFTMTVDEAVEAVRQVRPWIAVPVHMLKADPQEFRSKVEKVTDTEVVVLRPGERTHLGLRPPRPDESKL